MNTVRTIDQCRSCNCGCSARSFSRTEVHVGFYRRNKRHLLHAFEMEIYLNEVYITLL